MNRLVVGTRGSRLARIQTGFVTARLGKLLPDFEITEAEITTSGDRQPDVPLTEIGGTGVFAREIEDELLAGRIDLAVHSYKDLPTELPPGCVIAAVLRRESPEEALVALPGIRLAGLAPGSSVGTSSLLRIAQIRHARPDLAPAPIRGNVDTRLRKLDLGQYDALILAFAGLRRLGWEARATEILNTWFWAPGQGALAVEIRHGDERTAGLVRMLDDPPTRAVTDAERAFLRALEGGCRIPIGVRSRIEEGRIILDGLVAGPDGQPFLTANAEGAVEAAEEIGIELAEELIGRGAAGVLQSVREGER